MAGTARPGSPGVELLTKAATEFAAAKGGQMI